MQYGLLLNIVDPQTGVRRETDICAHTDSEILALNPVRDAFVAVVTSQGDPAECRLVLLDVRDATDQCIAAGRVITPVWSPDGTRLAYGIDNRIMLVQLADLTVSQEITSPTGTIKAVLEWVDDAHLLYGQYYRNPDSSGPKYLSTAEIHLVSLADNTDHILATNTANPHCFPVCDYQALVAYQP